MAREVCARQPNSVSGDIATNSATTGIYELEQIHAIINSTQILHVSFNTPDSPFPAILPMIGQMGSFDRPSSDLGDPLELYLHGYVSARIMNLARRGGSSGGNGGEDAPRGMPMCVAASHCDGLVLALSAFSHSYNYRSAVLFGHATLVEDPEEKRYAMQLITDGVVPGRWKDTRLPPNAAEMQSTSILKVKIASGSAKVREDYCSDEKHDMEDAEARAAHWTGVVPVYQTIGEPMPSSYNNDIAVPEYLRDYIKDFNQESKDKSLEFTKQK